MLHYEKPLYLYNERGKWIGLAYELPDGGYWVTTTGGSESRPTAPNKVTRAQPGGEFIMGARFDLQQHRNDAHLERIAALARATGRGRAA